MSLLKRDGLSQAFLDENAKLCKLAEEYEDRCEAYDVTVCSAKSPSGAAMPANGKELGLVCRNAREVMSEIANREGISIQTLQTAVHKLVR